MSIPKKIHSLKQLPKERQIMVTQLLDKHPFLKKPAKDFDEWGLRFPINYLNDIGGGIIVFPLEYMAEYVDVVTKTQIDDNDGGFIMNLITMEDDVDVNQYNTTAIGNLAYIALNCKNEQAKDVALKLLQNYLDYYREAILKEFKKRGNHEIN